MKSLKAIRRTATHSAAFSISSKSESACQGSTVVVDRGIAYAENLLEIKRRKRHYVVAARQPERDYWLDQFEELEGFRSFPVNPRL